MTSLIRYTAAVAIVAAAAAVTTMRPSAQQAPRSVFRSGRDVISVDVIVRDKSGAVVRGLTAADFEIREDGRRQEVVSFTFEEISDPSTRLGAGNAAPALESVALLARVEAKIAEDPA